MGREGLTWPSPNNITRWATEKKPRLRDMQIGRTVLELSQAAVFLKDRPTYRPN